MSNVKAAITELEKGNPILIFDSDDREGETDIVISAEGLEYKDITLLRNDGGGLICVAIHPHAAESLGLPYTRDILEDSGFEFNKDIPYDKKSSFSLWVNHTDTYTGITDKDRAKTAREIAHAVKIVLNDGSYNFESNFRSPGHVPILRGAKNLLKDRMGQTELSISLAIQANITPAILLCEMLDDGSGEALSLERAKKYGRKHKIPFVTGSEIKEHLIK